MNLYVLTQHASYLQQLLEDGDIDQQTFEDSLESLMIDDKFESICKVIRNLEAQASMFKEEAARLTAKQRTAENGVKRLKENLVNYMVTTDSKKVDSGLFTVSLRSSEACEITAADQIPADFYVPQEPKLSVSSIKETLKQGIDVPGAKLVKNPYVLIK